MLNKFKGLMRNISMYGLTKLTPLCQYHRILEYIYFYMDIESVELIFDLMNSQYILYLLMVQIFNILIDIPI